MLTGSDAQHVLIEILDNYKDGDQAYNTHVGSTGYYKNELGGFTAFDNTDGNCWTEDFRSVKAAINWINNGKKSSL